MRNIFVTAFILAIAIPVLSQGDEDLIPWSPSRKLTWSDYRGRPEPGSGAAASTTTYLTISYNIGGNGNFGFTIKSNFSKSHSWVINRTPYILSHEQGHFDIAEIFARKLYRKMSEYHFNRSSYEKDLNKIYDDVLKEKMKMQDDYDEETNHSINREKQAEWLKKIAAMLEESRDDARYQNNP